MILIIHSQSLISHCKIVIKKFVFVKEKNFKFQQIITWRKNVNFIVFTIENKMYMYIIIIIVDFFLIFIMHKLFTIEKKN